MRRFSYFNKLWPVAVMIADHFAFSVLRFGTVDHSVNIAFMNDNWKASCIIMTGYLLRYVTGQCRCLVAMDTSKTIQYSNIIEISDCIRLLKVCVNLWPNSWYIHFFVEFVITVEMYVVSLVITPKLPVACHQRFFSFDCLGEGGARVALCWKIIYIYYMAKDRKLIVDISVLLMSLVWKVHENGFTRVSFREIYEILIEN